MCYQGRNSPCRVPLAFPSCPRDSRGIPLFLAVLTPMSPLLLSPSSSLFSPATDVLGRAQLPGHLVAQGRGLRGLRRAAAGGEAKVQAAYSCGGGPGLHGRGVIWCMVVGVLGVGLQVPFTRCGSERATQGGRPCGHEACGGAYAELVTMGGGDGGSSWLERRGQADA